MVAWPPTGSKLLGGCAARSQRFARPQAWLTIARRGGDLEQAEPPVAAPPGRRAWASCLLLPSPFRLSPLPQT